MFGCGSSLVDEIVQKETVALKEAMMQLSEKGTQSFDPRICLLTSVVNGLTAAVCKIHALLLRNIGQEPHLNSVVHPVIFIILALF